MKNDEITARSTTNSDAAGKDELRERAAIARSNLASTLDAIEYKFNIPKQLRIKRRRLARALHELGEENGLALIGVALSMATVVGTVVWFAANAIVKSRED